MMMQKKIDSKKENRYAMGAILNYLHTGQFKYPQALY